MLCAGFLTVYLYESREEIGYVKAEQVSIVQREKMHLQDLLAAVAADLKVLAQNPLLTTLPAGGVAERGRLGLASEFMVELLRNKPAYDQARFLDLRGREVIRVDRQRGVPRAVAAAELQDKSQRYYVRDAMELGPGEVYISLFDLNVEHESLELPIKPMLRFCAGVFASDGRKVGLVVINYLGQFIISELKRAYSGSGRLELLNTVGYWLLGRDEGDEWGFMIGGRGQANMQVRAPVMWERIISAEHGQFIMEGELLTYCLVSRLGFARQKEAWYVLSRMPERALDQKLGNFREYLLLNLAGLLLAGVALAWPLAMNQVRRAMAEARIRRQAGNQAVLNKLLGLRLSDKPMTEILDDSLDIILQANWPRMSPRGGVFLTEQTSGVALWLSAQRGMAPEMVSMCAMVPFGACHCGRAALSGLIQCSEKVDHRHENRFAGMDDHGHYAVPLMKNDRCLGVLVLYPPTGRPLRGEEKAFLEAVGNVLANIIDSRRAEDRVQESETRLRAVVETAAEGIIVADSKGVVTAFNPAAERIFGYKAAEVKGKNVTMLQPEHLRGAHDGFLQSYLATREPKVIGVGREVQGRRKDGSMVPLFLSLSDMRLGERTMFTGILRDITELKQVQARLEDAKEKAEEISKDLLRKQRVLDEDLMAAAGIQQALLPGRRHAFKGMDLAWRFVPSQYIGGDIFNVTALDADHLCLYMVDVSGHGVQAALVSVSVHETLGPLSGRVVEGLATDSPRIVPPREVVELLDKEYPLERFDKYFTMFYGVLNLRTGHLVYTNAAHPSPLLLRPDGELIKLKLCGGVVGLDGMLPFEQEDEHLRPGDRLFCYTDGVLEYFDEQDEMFGFERLSEFVLRHKEKTSEIMLELLLTELTKFGNGRQPRDDISVFVIDYKGRAE